MRVQPTFVVDSSVTLTWCFEDEACDYGDSVLRALSGSMALAPPIWPTEVANALLMGERRGRSNQMQTLEWAELLETLPIAIAEVSLRGALREVVSLARQQRLTSYDAAYLELAMRRGLPLATLDQRLRDAAAAVGVHIYSRPAQP